MSSQEVLCYKTVMCDEEYTTVVYYTIIGLATVCDVFYYLHMLIYADLTAGPTACVIYLKPYSGANGLF